MDELDSHNLARITIVPAAEAIGPEDRSFTPWLAAHIGLLADATGLPLSLGDGSESLDELLAQNTEVAVGNFRLDVRAFTADGRVAAIENQYGTSDHSHLGQVITYASGVEADVVIWIAERFTDPHLEAIRWLNQRTDESCAVFAVRVEFLRIAGSAAAPRFEVVARPSEWVRAQRQAQTAASLWTLDEFLEAIRDPADRDSVQWLAERSLATSSRGLWMGKKPSGQMSLHAGGHWSAPVGIAIRSDGTVIVRGLWTHFNAIFHHPLFRPVAEFLGQDHLGPATGVPISQLDLEALWRVCDAYGQAANVELPGDPNSASRPSRH